jgi:Glycosyl transferases group 1
MEPPAVVPARRLDDHDSRAAEQEIPHRAATSQRQHRNLNDESHIQLMPMHEAQTESPTRSPGKNRTRRRHDQYQHEQTTRRRSRHTRIRKAGTRIVPIALLISQVPYLWRTNDFYSRLHSSRVDSVNDVSYLPLPHNNNETQQQQAQSLDAAEVNMNAVTNNVSGPLRGSIVPSSLYTPEPSRPLSIRWIGGTGSGPTSAVLDGAKRSLYVSIISTCWYDPNPFLSEDDRISIVSRPRDSTVPKRQSDVVVTVVDWATLGRDCHVLRKILSHPQCSVGGSLSVSDDHRPNHSAFVYWDATNILQAKTCLLEESMNAIKRPLNASSIHYVRRSSVQDRYWNDTAQWVARGRLRPGPSEQTKNDDSQGIVWHRSGHPLREAFVNELLANVKRANLPKLPHKKRPRKVSVFHKPGNVVPSAVLRNVVSEAVLEVATNHSLTHRVDEAVGSSPDAISDELVPRKYVKSLIMSQIVVVANHDEWEGHWRLLESMASGAMVLSEVMVAPPQGLQNGTNVVLYDSVASLQRLLLHYAAHGEERRRIAERGQRLALGLHRSWNDFERVMFGQARTQPLMPFADAPPRRP